MAVANELNGMTEIALFAGAGGGVLGSKMLGIRTVAYVEWDAYPQAILKARMADGLLENAPVFGDVREFDTAPYAGKTDIVSGGFPCQPFSTAGRREADFDPRNMWPATRDIIRGVRPKYAYLENVAGLLTGTHGYFGVVLGELAASGYDVAWTCLPAAAIGAPHRRDRLWILGRRRDGEGRIVPEGTLAEFARFDTVSKAWCRFDGRCRGDTESTVTSYIPFPRSGTVAIAPDGTTTVYALDPVAQADGTTRGGWPWPRILEDLRIPDPAASVKDAPIATDVEMMPTPNAFDAHAVGTARSASRPEWGRHGVSLHHLAAEWSAQEGRTWATPTAGIAKEAVTPGMADRVDRRNDIGNLLEDVAHSLYGEGSEPPRTAWPTPTGGGLNGGSGAVNQLENFVRAGVDRNEAAAMLGRAPNKKGSPKNDSKWPTPMATQNRKSIRAMADPHSGYPRAQGSPPGLEQAVELAAGILPKEFEDIDLNILPTATRALIETSQTQGEDAKESSPRNTWPTPTASDAVGGAGTHGRQGGPNLRSAVDSRPPKKNDTGVASEAPAAMNLDDLIDLSSDDTPIPWHILNPTVNVREGQFPTPAAADSFCNAADGFSPLGRFIQNEGKRPPRRSKEEREAARANRGPVGQLNPDWVEWLMGWPIGWTAMAPMSPASVAVYAMTMPGPWWQHEPPTIPRITVGTADRAGRLKACGNGQVSLANAAAFEILLETFRQIEIACNHGGPGAISAFDILGL